MDKKITLPERVLTYSVPLYVVVTDDGFGGYAVSRAVINDQEPLGRTNDITDGPTGAPIPIDSPALEDIVQRIADGATEFPAWEFGW